MIGGAISKLGCLLVRAAVLGAAALASGCGGAAAPLLDRATLLDPAACQSCHPQHHDEWSGSMHAYASDDPVFLAMNRRAQRETNGALGDFCVKCHAPVAVREGLTTDGLNLAELPQKVKGVTCYFCHAVTAVEGTHNNPLVLASDNALYGPFSDPVAGTPHRAHYSTLMDDTHVDSAAACGACHDIVNQHDAHVERTFQEWGETLFAKPPRGSTCIPCHMDGRDGPASSTSSKTRRLHGHEFAAVDLALTPLPNAAAQRQKAQNLLDTTVQSTICYDNVGRQIFVTLDNVGAGHGWPSGATPDRRAWVQLTAYAGADVVYASGGPEAEPLEASPDPDLWLIRDCLFDAAGAERTMFWEAVSLTGNQLPGSIVMTVSDPSSFSRTHIQKVYPGETSPPLAQAPDRITLRIHLKAIGDDVLADLVATGDLDPAIPPNIARYELGAGAALEWTRAAATPVRDPSTGLDRLCVTTQRTVPTMSTPAVSHAHCVRAEP